jgi:hypothetical protein
VLPLDVPVDLGRDAAAELARRELAKQAYQRDEDWLTAAGRWVVEHLAELLDRAASASPGGYLGLLVALALLVAVAVVVRLGTGPLARSTRATPLLEAGRPVSAAEHRAEAARSAQAGRWAEAVRARLRALATDLAERGVLEDRPGRTADELATEVARALPSCERAVRAAVRVFDETWYGGRAASSSSYDTVARADDLVRATQPMVRAAR